MASIIDLPREVVRLIPSSYRAWQLLRLTCHTLEAALGDHHESRNILYIDIKNNTNLTYRTLVDTLINAMSNHEVLCNGLVVLYECEGIHKTLATWHGTHFTAYCNGRLAGLLYPVFYLPGVDYYITIGKVNYKSTLVGDTTIEQLLSVVYYELPHLFSKMTVTIRSPALLLGQYH